MTWNQQFFDASIRHQIDLLRYGAGVSRKVNSILDETRADLRVQVEKRLGKSVGNGLDSGSLKRLRELERAIDQQRSGAWNDVNAQWERTAVDVALEEPLFVRGALTSLLPVELDLTMPSDGTLRALATARPFHGKTLREWASSAQRSDIARIHQQIRIGMVQGEGSRDIANRVFGSRGAMSITANQADAVTRTVINHVSNAAQQEFLAENSDLFDVEQLVATLDARTTPICRAEDGKQYPIGKGPIPPLHVRCRSIRVAVLNGDVVGERPFKAGTEQQMLREFGESKGLSGIKSRDDLPRGQKRAFDEFSRRRMRELTGQVPARTSYQEWLTGQSAEFQDDVLGPARAKLFRDGGLTLDRFVNRQGDELTLDELRERNRAEWDKAGLGERQGSSKPPEIGTRSSDTERKRREAEAAIAAAAEAERKAKAERERLEKAREAAAEAEKKAREERERLEAERKARDAEEKKRIEREEVLRKVEEARKARREQELAKKAERERKAQEEAARKKAESGPETKKRTKKLSKAELEKQDQQRREAELAEFRRKAAERAVRREQLIAEEQSRRAASVGPKTRQEAIAALKNHVENVIIGDSVADSDVIDAFNALKECGLEQIYPESRKLTNLVLGAKRVDAGVGAEVNITTISDRANGVYSSKEIHGSSYIKIADGVKNPTAIEIEKMENLTKQYGAKPGQGLVQLGVGSKTDANYKVNVRDNQELTRVIVHEFGHAVHLERVGAWYEIDDIVRNTYHQSREAISGYGDSNYMEYFAEAHVAYRHRNEELRRDAPRAYAMVEQVLRLRGIKL